MKIIRTISMSVLFMSVITSIFTSVVLFGGSNAQANETMNFQGQTIVLLNESTVDAINAEIAQKTLLADKQVAVKALLAHDAFAKGGYCDTAVKELANATKPTAAKVQEACQQVFNDDDLNLAIANGELSTVTDPTAPQMSFRHKLSFALTEYIKMVAIGPF